MMKWLKWFAAAIMAVMAVLFIRRSESHAAKQGKLAEKARKLERDKNASVEKALAARNRAEAAKLREKAALKEGEARIHELNETDKNLAERVRDYNARRAERLRNRNAP